MMKKFISLSFAVCFAVLACLPVANAAWYDSTVESFNLNDPNATIDTFYLFKTGTVVAGPGSNIAEFGPVDLRAAYIPPTSGMFSINGDQTDAKIGLGLAYDVTDAMDANSGKWLLNFSGLKLGISGIIDAKDLKKIKVEPAIFASKTLFKF